MGRKGERVTRNAERFPRGPKTTDLVERMFFLKLMLPTWGILWFGFRILLKAQYISRPVALLLMWVVAPMLASVIAILFSRFLSGVATAVMGGLHSSGGERHSREYSEQQALVVAGRFDDAVDSYQAHLVAFPEDVEARLRLAALYAGGAQQPEAAERQFLEVRDMPHSPRQALVIGNALIDLYRSTGQRHALKAELARFARVHQGSAAGEQARQHLRHLVEEDHRVS